DGKVKKDHVGRLSDPKVNHLLRKSNVNQAMVKRSTESETLLMQQSIEIDSVMEALALFVDSLPKLLLLDPFMNWQPTTVPPIGSGCPDVGRFKHALNTLPPKRTLRQWCKRAQTGDLKADRQLRKIVDATQIMLNGLEEQIQFFSLALIDSLASGSHLMSIALKQRIRSLRESVQPLETGPDFNLQLLDLHTIVRWDVLRCCLLASQPCLANTRASRFQKFADRSLRRLQKLIRNLPAIDECSKPVPTKCGAGPDAAADQTSSIDQLASASTQQLLQSLCRLAAAGNADAKEYLERLVIQYPAAVDSITDLPEFARKTIIQRASFCTDELKQSFNQSVIELRDSVRSNSSQDPWNQLLVDAAIICAMDSIFNRLAAAIPNQSSSAVNRHTEFADRASSRYEQLKTLLK
ncbi:hypothetical protein NHH03_27395, partial [Stieleria sp. TO1_6]|uniref:hypothetical protein n=1 Tax=Stieleria tagensis TaxID=2956795 RepID=UPI00209B0BA6